MTKAMKAQFEFGGQQFVVAGDAALYWPAQSAMLVADLHLEKGSSYAARYAQMLPPYDSLDTLRSLSVLIAEYAPRHVYCLGDNFHDIGGETRLSSGAADLLRQLTAQLDWCWIVGNHDPELAALFGGRVAEDVTLADITLRHAADLAWTGAEITGHYHPKYRVKLLGRTISRRCFVANHRKLIMPAFGAFTGGLDATDSAILDAIGIGQDDSAMAYLSVDNRVLRFALTK
jgi:uncharacterized protein